MGIRLDAIVLILAVLASPLFAQTSPAGAWRTLHSEHFRVHYRPGQDSVAYLATREFERAYSLLATELVRPRQNIDVVLSDAADFSNGAAAIFPSNRITLLLVPPTAEPDLQNFDDWLRVVITHELTHIFHLDRVKGPWRVMQALLGRVPGGFPNVYQPSWVTEGIATYYESHFTRRGRLRGSFHTEMLLSIAAADRWPRANEATYLSERWPDGVAPYAFGSRFIGYLAATAGDSSVPRYIERTSGQWIPFRTGRPLRLATGFRRDSLWNRYAVEHRERAAARAEGTAEVVARGLRAQPSAAIAEDGSVAWLEASLDNAARIVIRRPDGGDEHHLTTGGVDLAWAGDTLYVTRLELKDPATYRSDLHRLAGGHWQQLTQGERLSDLTVTPEGIVAVQLGDQGNRLVRVADSVVPLTEHRLAASFATPASHVAGTLVTVWHYQSTYHLRIVGDPTSNIIHVGRGNEVLADPAWVGDTLLFVSDRSGLPQVYEFVSGGEPTQVTDEPFGARQPGVSSDGWLYFSSLEADGYALKRTRWRPPRPTSEPVTGQPDEAILPADPPAEVPIRATGYQPWAALRPHYFIPYLVDKGVAGIFLGAFTSGGDPVGRVGYAARLARSLNQGGHDASLFITYRRWNHHSLDLFLSQDYGDAGVVAAPEPLGVRSRERDGELGFNTTWRRWYRSLTLRFAADYEQDYFRPVNFISFINPEFIAGSVGLAAGRTLHPPLAISDEDGATFSLRYRRRWRLDQDGWSDEWRSRVTLYRAIRGLGGFAHPVLAARITAATSSGPDRETFGVGGASGIAYQPLPGIVAGSGRAFPVRGFEPGELRGGRVGVASAELRIPLALVAEPFWDLPYGLDRVSLRLFYDYGRAWDPPSAGRPDWIHSTGVEVTWDLLVLYDVPLRLRSGVALPLNDGSVTRRGDLRFGIGFGSEF